MIKKLLSYFILTLTYFYVITFIIVINFFKILKYRLVYFKSPVTINYPNCVNDKKYGKSNFINVQTTKGIEFDKTMLNLHYVVNGEKKRPTILFLHGFPEFWFSWRHQILEFSKEYRVIAMDMRGYGLSDKPENVCDYQIKHLVNDIKGFLDALNIDSVILISHDWGGFVAWYFENFYPEMVEKFIALNIPEPSAFRVVINRSWEQFFKSWYIYFFQVPFLPEWNISRLDLKSIEEFFQSDRAGLRNMKLTGDEIKAFKANMAIPGALTSSINYYRAMFRYPPSFQKPNDRRNESGRYMLIFGEADVAISVKCAKESKTFVPNINLKLLPGLSHWVQQDDPILVNRLISEFIGS